LVCVSDTGGVGVLPSTSSCLRFGEERAVCDMDGCV
jgi:hypothetical protein